MEEYKTLEKSSQDEFVERKSRFIGYASPIQSEDEALKFIAAIKSKHWDATHNVYAYVLREGNICRYSDDGEPSGTAGIPVLNVVQKNALTDCVVVVTRYFGGILLGGGGLVRAYSHSASIGITAAGIVTMRLSAICSLHCDYSQYGRVSSLIPECGGIITDSQFGSDVEISFSIVPDSFDSFSAKLADATSGSVTAKITGEKYIKAIRYSI